MSRVYLHLPTPHHVFAHRVLVSSQSARATTILLSYRRAILISVYTHLLLLDHSQVWWRWSVPVSLLSPAFQSRSHPLAFAFSTHRASITLFLLVWAAELIFDADDDDQLSGASSGLGLGGMDKWKSD